MARLILATAEGGQQAIELLRGNSLGRHPNNSIQLLDKIVSKEHCLIEQRGEHFVLRDLGSLNGTYINGERVRGEGVLKHGDEIALGATRARFDDGSGRPLASSYLPPSPGWQQTASIPGHAPSGPAAPSAPSAVSDMTYRNPAVLPGSLEDPATAVRHSGTPSPGFAQAEARPGFAQAEARPGFAQAEARPGFAQAEARPGFGHGGTPAVGLPHPRPGASPLAQSTNSHPGTPLREPPRRPVGPTVIASGSKNFHGTRIDVQDQDRAIGTQIAATQKGFLPYDQIAQDPAQVRVDYERLRASHELSQEIALERDTGKLLDKILVSIFKFIRADRGVIFLKKPSGELEVGASRRRDGTDAPIQVSATIMNRVMDERAAVLTHDAAMDFAGAKGKSMILNRISSAIVVPLLHDDEILGVLWLDSETLAQFQRKDLELVTAIVNQAAMFIEINILAKKIEREIVTRERFSRLLSPNVAERVISGQLEIKKGGELVRECTVFNSDIRGFTAMSERTEPQIIVDMLNEYFELMVDKLFKYEGTLDKFMGDGIMALWGAPVAHPDDACLSVQCALEQMMALGDFNRARMATGQPALAIGIGIHTGPLVAGYIGSSKALSYTVIGDTANTSARLCGIATPGQIIVSETTYARLGPRFEYQELPPAHVKNKANALRIFNVVRERPQVAVPAAQDAS